MSEWELQRSRQLLVHIAPQNPRAPARQTPAPGSVPPRPRTVWPTWNVGRGRSGPLTFPHDGTQVQDMGWVCDAPTEGSGPGAGLQGQGDKPSREGPCGPALGRGLHPSEEWPPASGWGLSVGAAGVVRVPGFPPIATNSQTSDLRNVT